MKERIGHLVGENGVESRLISGASSSAGTDNKEHFTRYVDNTL
jgi:hypothetical protein